MEEFFRMSQSNLEKCLICFNILAGQQVAIPENCDHCFCLDCILEWSRNNNTCPVDRIVFNVIYQMDYLGGKVKNMVKIERRLNQKEDMSENQTICEKCGRFDFVHMLIMCSTCEAGYHAGCLTPPLSAVPAQDWVCQECADNCGSLSAEEEDVSDDEMADILAEAVPTSGRLRLSTLTSTSSLMGTRRSRRLRGQANKASRPETHRAQHVPKYLLKSAVQVTSSSSNVQRFCSSNLRHKRKKGGTDLQ